MTVYRYLDNPVYARNWTEGGPQPLRLNTCYLDGERKGIRTPDEGTVLLGENASAEQFDFMRKKLFSGPVRIHARNVLLPGGGKVENFHIDWAAGLVLCFSNQPNHERWRAEGKKVCIAVDYPRVLFHELSKQIPEVEPRNHVGNRERRCGLCQYTKSGHLDVFLKHEDERWQDEFRMYWPAEEERIVTLPAKSGRLVWEA